MKYPVFFLLLISNFRPLWLKKILGMISVFFNLLRLVLWPIIWSVLENVQCPLEKTVCSVTVEKNILYMSVRAVWSKVWFKFNIFLFIFCLDDLSIIESGILKSPAIIVLFISSFRSVSICLIYLGALMLDAYIFIIDISSWWIELTYLSVSVAFLSLV